MDYYFGNSKYSREVIRAGIIFFNDIPPDKATDQEQAFFNEWFVFDFILSNGKTPLQDFYDRNPYNYNFARLQIYKNLQKNEYGLYEVSDIEKGKSMALKNLRSGKSYKVREYSASFQLNTGELFFSRVADLGDHFELVGADSFKMPPESKKILVEEFGSVPEEIVNPKILKDTMCAAGLL
ncbi:hypothetical protein HYT01_03585 [Candidatus Giovannonibacteria bacterium]|nr:hypothetical protein [Candidatus Giovannonibacteria bacterium]